MASSSAPTFMDMSGGATQPNPFAIPTAGQTIPTSAGGFQHGSLEQNTGTDSRGTYQHLLTPTPPRSPSARGQR